MVYVRLVGFLDDFFGGSGPKIFEDALSKTGIIDIDKVDKKKRKEFADYILKNHLNFSPQKNRYLYQEILKILELSSMFDLREYTEEVTKSKKEENVVISSFQLFWQKIEKAYTKYEVILNLFWMKAVDAELKGTNKEFVNGIIKKSLVLVREDIGKAYQELITDLDLSKYKKHKKIFTFKIDLFGNIDYPISENLPDIDTQYLIDSVNILCNILDHSHNKLKELLFTSLETDIELKSSGQDDAFLLNDIKENILFEWNHLKNTYNKIYKELEKKYS